MINYFKESFKRKRARRFTQEFPYRISKFNLELDGMIEFANWENPLVKSINVTQSEIDFYRKFVKKGDFIIDIGANIGDTTVPMAIAAGKQGVTLAFDPNPYVFKILEVNAKLNSDKTNIIPIMNAISTKEEDFYYMSSEASFSNGWISQTKKSRHGKFVYPNKIKGINLLNFLKKNHNQSLGRLSFIKIDAEGYDKEIIKSISDLITEYKPTIIAESFGKSTNDAKKELFEVISRHGYDLFYFEDFKSDANNKKINAAHEMINWKNTMNIYAIPNEKLVNKR